MKKNNGITLIALVITVALLLILTITCVVNIDGYLEEKTRTNFEKDIFNLEEEISQYYSRNKQIPIINKYILPTQINSKKNPNDNENYYVIDIRELDVNLNYGKDFDTIITRPSTDEINDLLDVYIINEQSHTIYYPKGINYADRVLYNINTGYTDIQLRLNVLTENYIGFYDGKLHSAKVECKKEGTQIKYGLTEGTYDLDEIPSYSNVGEYIVYYEATKEDYPTVEGSVTIKINPAPLPTLASQITSENYGDEVNYSVTVNGVTLDNWKIFYKDEDTNEVIMIYNDYLPNSTGLAAGAGLETSDNCKVYSNIDRTDLIDKLNNTKNWSDLLNGNIDLSTKATAKGAVDLETWVASWNAKGYTRLYIAKEIGMYDGLDGYYVGTSENPTSWYQSITSDTTGYGDTLYFPYKEKKDNCNGYWIASPSAYGIGNTMLIIYSGTVHRNIYNYGSFGSCPVINLTSSVLTSGKDAGGAWTIQ